MGDTARFWDGIAAGYATQKVENPEAFERKIAITRGLMSPEDLVLDIGCGTGSLVLRLADAGRRVHGLDISGEMIRIAREKAEAGAVKNVEFHVGTLDDELEVLQDAHLNGVCAYSILHLLEDRPAALARIFRALKPGGFFVSSTVCLGESWVPIGFVIGLMQKFGKAPPVVSTFGKSELALELEAAGFEDVEDHEVGAKKTIAFLTARKPA